MSQKQLDPYETIISERYATPGSDNPEKSSIPGNLQLSPKNLQRADVFIQYLEKYGVIKMPPEFHHDPELL